MSAQHVNGRITVVGKYLGSRHAYLWHQSRHQPWRLFWLALAPPPEFSSLNLCPIFVWPSTQNWQAQTISSQSVTTYQLRKKTKEYACLHWSFFTHAVSSIWCDDTSVLQSWVQQNIVIQVPLNVLIKRNDFDHTSYGLISHQGHYQPTKLCILWYFKGQ